MNLTFGVGIYYYDVNKLNNCPIFVTCTNNSIKIIKTNKTIYRNININSIYFVYTVYTLENYFLSFKMRGGIVDSCNSIYIFSVLYNSVTSSL